MTNCQPLSSWTADTLVITKDNVQEIVPDVFDLTPGTQVTVSCNGGYTLVGQATFSCSATGQWSYPSKPYCDVNSGTTEAPSGALDQDTKIMIGVVCAIAALIVIALVVMIIAIWARDRRRRRERREFWEGIRRDRDGPEYRGRDGPSTIDMEMYSRSPRGLPPPPPYDGRRNGSYRDYYNDIKKSRRSRSIDDISVHEKKPYVRDWVKRSSQLGHDDDYYDRAGVHGRRDPYFWRDSPF